MDALARKYFKKGNEWIKRNIFQVITVLSVLSGVYFGHCVCISKKRPDLYYESITMGALIGLTFPLSLFD